MSTQVRKVFSHRFLLAISLVLTMIALSFVLAQPPKAEAGASACPPQAVRIIYYTDASMTVACGWETLGCSCYHSRWGCRTEYSTGEYLDCY
jgi:hypothetical protein